MDNEPRDEFVQHREFMLEQQAATLFEWVIVISLFMLALGVLVSAFRHR